MNNLFINSAYFGLVLTLGTYMLGVWIKKKTGLAIMNPLLVSTAFVIAFLLITKVDYQTYNEGAKYISYLLTPATVCLAVPLYKQLKLLQQNMLAVVGGISSGVEETANFLLDTMSIMFVPATVGLIEHVDLLKAVIIPFSIIVVISTVIVMAVTGKVTQLLIHKTGKKENK